MTKKINKSWGGRFSEAVDEFVQSFSQSVSYDQRLCFHDIKGSIAHATMLGKVGVIPSAEADLIVDGLERIAVEIENGQFEWSIELEDVHMNIEARLTDLIGEAGKKLHTGRSRNDQVATDIRLYLRDEIIHLVAEIQRLQSGLLDLAEAEAETIMPGFTHLQVAQPISFGHHVLAWFEMLERDKSRLFDCHSRMNVMPLGSAALAGTSYPIDRALTAELLGFTMPCNNSLDGVSDRDFAIEFCAAAALISTHLSRIAEEIILWTSAQFNFIRLPDRFCTGSSIMPQKKNPDVAELVRGKSGRITGNLVALLTLMKGQPLAYNRDNQEDKEPLFDTIDTIAAALTAFADMLPAIEANRDVMAAAARQGFSTATDLADYLVRKGMPFRDAHEVVGKAVHFAGEKNCDLADLALDELQNFSETISDDVYDVMTLSGSINSRDHLGGTAPKQVREQIAAHRKNLS